MHKLPNTMGGGRKYSMKSAHRGPCGMLNCKQYPPNMLTLQLSCHQVSNLSANARFANCSSRHQPRLMKLDPWGLSPDSGRKHLEGYQRYVMCIATTTSRHTMLILLRYNAASPERTFKPLSDHDRLIIGSILCQPGCLDCIVAMVQQYAMFG
jgi:hypothetical protein